MVHAFRAVRAVILASALAALAGCSHMRSAEEAYMPEGEWPTLHHNIQARVAFDETFSSFPLFNHDARGGVGPSEQQYRRVIFWVANPEGGRPISGFVGQMAAEAVVPDGTPPLKAGDLIEVRHVRTYDYLKDFAQTGEGNAMLRLICPAGAKTGRQEQEDFKKCASQAPWLQAWGEEKRFYFGILAADSGRPYAVSLKDHKELRFTPYYDARGATLPGAVPMGSRPHIATWKYPPVPQ